MLALALIAGLVALVWLAIIFWRGGLVAGALAVLVTGSVVGPAFFSLPTPPIPLTVDRALLGLLVVQYIVWRNWGHADPKPLGRADLVFGVFLAVLVLSTFLSDFRSQDNYPIKCLLFFYLMPAAMYWVARQARLDRRSVLATFGVLGLFSVYLAVTAVAEIKNQWWLVFPQYIRGAAYEEFLGRGRGPFLNPAANGIFLGTGLASLLMFWPRLGRPARGALVALAGAVLGGVYATLTRCAWLGGAAGLMVLGGLALPRTWRWPVLGAMLVSGGLVVAAKWESILSFKRDKGLDASVSADSAALRPILAAVAWKMVLDRPLFGCGYGQYRLEMPNYLHDRQIDLHLETARPYVQHNIFLSQATEIGLVGMGLYMALLGCWGREAWRAWRETRAPLWARQTGLLFLAHLAVYLPNGMFQDVTIAPMVNMLVFFLAGLAVNARHVAEAAREPARAARGAVAMRPRAAETAEGWWLGEAAEPEGVR